jgi:urease subunit beta
MHFFEANRRLKFARRLAFGMRLDIPAGSAVRWEPGETKEVQLVEFTGKRQIWGFNGLVNGQITEGKLHTALELARQRGFLTEE